MREPDTNIKMIEQPRPTPTEKRVNKIVIFALIVAMFSIGIMLSWALQSDDVLEVKKVPIPSKVIQDSHNGNGVVVLEIDVCKNVTVEGIIRTSFVSKTREVFLPLSTERSREGCRHSSLPVVIPKELPPDTYKVRIRATYSINPLKQNVIEEFESSEFTISQAESELTQ